MTDFERYELSRHGKTTDTWRRPLGWKHVVFVLVMPVVSVLIGIYFDLLESRWTFVTLFVLPLVLMSVLYVYICKRGFANKVKSIAECGKMTVATISKTHAGDDGGTIMGDAFLKRRSKIIFIDYCFTDDKGNARKATGSFRVTSDEHINFFKLERWAAEEYNNEQILIAFNDKHSMILDTEVAFRNGVIQ